jgi:outer membrane receptor for ferrienterochelin and colicin
LEFQSNWRQAVINHRFRIAQRDLRGDSRHDGEASNDYSAVYVKDEYTVSDKLLIIPSLRYDDSDKFDGNTSPKLIIPERSAFMRSMDS